MELFSEGAESSLYRKDKTSLIKIREAKTYRIESIDLRLRKERTKREAKILEYLHQKEIHVPKLLEMKVEKEEMSITIEYLNAKVLKEVLDETLLSKAFEEIMNMHEAEVVHGDLTTLNMLTKEKDVFLIDFGLSKFSKKIEDRASDLHLFFTCIKNEHPQLFSLKKNLLEKYKLLSFGEAVVKRLENIEKRGRNKK
ncbi:Kae1-associated serine/threonine protein kinase [Candidatus Woesearchaeota archaeon]|nr:Kae1-associated serine/threonine protein kinase [Nanoarchaeota archaeon]MCB9371153.1 Kae1-associated serine/threonine protein kinase [Candidatus Woesearchaeota archaeon]USN43852.1 MAG: Kae1-associated serine/threonine protein kinase [Candidatus Woesearchaeota archaeon]